MYVALILQTSFLMDEFPEEFSCSAVQEIHTYIPASNFIEALGPLCS